MDLTIISRNASGLEGQVVARTSDDKKISVNIKRQADNVCKVFVRVGTFGNEAIQNQILAAIMKRL